MNDYLALIQRLRHGVGTIDADRNAAADAIETLLDERSHLQQRNAIMWNEGHAKGARELKTYIQQSAQAQKADAWGNARLTETLLEVEDERDKLRAALRAVLALDIKGHQLQDRLQFSDAGRALLAQCRAALAWVEG